MISAKRRCKKFLQDRVRFVRSIVPIGLMKFRHFGRGKRSFHPFHLARLHLAHNPPVTRHKRCAQSTVSSVFSAQTNAAGTRVAITHSKATGDKVVSHRSRKTDVFHIAFTFAGLLLACFIFITVKKIMTDQASTCKPVFNRSGRGSGRKRTPPDSLPSSLMTAAPIDTVPPSPLSTCHAVAEDRSGHTSDSSLTDKDRNCRSSIPSMSIATMSGQRHVSPMQLG